MRRILILLTGGVVTLALAGLVTTGLAMASGGRATLQLRQTKLGKILVNGRGRTLYLFAADKRNKDNCITRIGCLAVWPALTTSGKPVAKAGAKTSLIGTIKLSNGQTQVTYAGHPLYTYVADSRAGQTFGEGVLQSGARWYVLNGAGKVIKK